MPYLFLKKKKIAMPAKLSAGFTLIEMLVSIGIFSVLMGVLSGIFLASMKSQTHIVYTQYLIDESNFVLDYMSRYIRMAQKDDTGSCVGIVDGNLNPPNAVSDSIVFLDYRNKCHQFLLDVNSGKIVERISQDNTSANFEAAQNLTSDKLVITDLKFNDLGGENSDGVQPKITIMIKAEANTERLDPPPSINVQTTISQRNLDKEI